MAAERYRELLRIRRSSPVFGLPTADEVQRRVSFPLGGPAETPGVIVMCLDGTGLDPRWRQLVVVFNATTPRSPSRCRRWPRPAPAPGAGGLGRPAAAHGRRPPTGALTVPSPFGRGLRRGPPLEASEAVTLPHRRRAVLVVGGFAPAVAGCTSKPDRRDRRPAGVGAGLDRAGRLPFVVDRSATAAVAGQLPGHRADGRGRRRADRRQDRRRRGGDRGADAGRADGAGRTTARRRRRGDLSLDPTDGHPHARSASRTGHRGVSRSCRLRRRASRAGAGRPRAAPPATSPPRRTSGAGRPTGCGSRRR